MVWSNARFARSSRGTRSAPLPTAVTVGRAPSRNARAVAPAWRTGRADASIDPEMPPGGKATASNRLSSSQANGAFSSSLQRCAIVLPSAPPRRSSRYIGVPPIVWVISAAPLRRARAPVARVQT